MILKKIPKLREELVSLADQIRQDPQNSDVKVWKSTRMSKRLDWLEDKERRRALVPSILQIQAALSYETDELSSLLATVNKH